MKLLLTGAEGQLGRHLLPQLARMAEVVTTSRCAGDRPCDLTDANAIGSLLDEVKPEVIVNSAGWTAVDAAEDKPEAAAQLNRDLPERLAQWCRRSDALLVHYSTDYVFHGQPGRPWNERDDPDAVSVYGRSKLAGERAIQDCGAKAVILRTAWLYSALPGNFLSAILARANHGEGLRVVSDQIGSPTWAGSLARMTTDLLQQGAVGAGAEILHAADRGCMSWHEFAAMAVAMAADRGLIAEVVPVEPIKSAQWPQRAPRPSCSVLDVTAMERACGRAIPEIRESLAACLDQWTPKRC